MTDVSVPRRGTRPANRKALILKAARELFRSQGYEHVRLRDIAAATEVTPAALYRHFSSKEQLLLEVIGSALEPLEHLVSTVDLSQPEPALAALAKQALRDRDVGVLWQREARHLTPAARRELSDAVGRIGRKLGEQVGVARPELDASSHDLLAWSILSVYVSTSFHQLEAPRQDFEELLVRLARRVLDAHPPSLVNAVPASAAGLSHRSRREEVLAEAVRLFAERTYTSVGVDDIADSLGMAGPSIYNHVPNKIDLLLTPLARGTAYLSLQTSEALASARDPADGLARMSSGYAHFAFNHHQVLDLLITEVRNLPEDPRKEAVDAQREYIDEWVHLLLQVDPGLDPTKARIEVHAALTVINDAARTAHLRRLGRGEEAVVALAHAVLGVSG
ncbi:TetR/AcrR family transcriptional regulator [Nocardioides sp. QY071]|uniref:TetR/AcrR family transcriptional regulator n=1 Tax=Nocardioides sp. QY071 TaxID=3044187 RepID=UPI00249B4AA0|nr:TetR/AcrR family transcriptional regulator [Nocardioides sp. QY071]WGY00427.1 TetR/AcrR family transcriptional regulator [Nocardioides sp. QY071]